MYEADSGMESDTDNYINTGFEIKNYIFQHCNICIPRLPYNNNL